MSERDTQPAVGAGAGAGEGDALAPSSASAAALVAAFRSRQTTPTAALEAVLAGAAAWEPALHALWAPDADGARAQAEASTRRWRAGAPLSALDGMPITLKENIASRGVAVPLGSAAVDLVPAAADSPVAARLREAGAVLWAKTTMPDYGMLSSGLSSFHALARNPWNLAMNPGGSSAGAAAACGAGLGPIHLGTDIGGSIRLPAAWCGVVGFKPSAGRIPIQPAYAGRVAGPLARSVADVVASMPVLSRPDARDPTALPWADLPWTAALGAPSTAGSAGPRPAGPASDPAHDAVVLAQLRGRRIGLWLDAGWGLPVEPWIAAGVRRAAQAFAQAGAEIVEIAPFCTRAMADGMDRFWRMRSWLDLQALPEARRNRVLPYIRQWVAAAAHYSGAEVFTGYSQMAALRDAALAASAGVDVLLSPTTPCGHFPAEWASPLNDPERPFEHIAFTLPFNMSGQPAVSVDARRADEGHLQPLGLQLVTGPHDDVGALRWARAWELLRGPGPAWPSAPDTAV